MWKKLALAVTLFSIAAVFAAQLAAKPPKDKAPQEPPPSGPGLIAVNDVGFITLMKADGSEPTPIDLMVMPSGRGDNWQGPAWSPLFRDGKIILAYPRSIWNEAGQSIGTELVATVIDPGNLDDRDEHVVFTSPFVGADDPPDPDAGGIFQVDCSPFEDAVDGGYAFQVAFSTFRDLYDPSKQRQIIRILGLVYDPFAAAGTRISRSPAMDQEVDAGVGASYWQARFSPVDGGTLALSRSEKVDGSYVKSIWLAMKVEGGYEQSELIADSPEGYDWKPAWSPDGAELAFLSLRRPKRKLTQYIRVYKFATGAIEDLTASAAVWLSWSPDGKQIVYGTEGGQPNVGFFTSGLIGKIIMLEGTVAQYDLGTGRYPDWSPYLPQDPQP